MTLILLNNPASDGTGFAKLELRNDVEGETTASSLRQTLGDSIKPIPIEPGLIIYLSNPNYRDFLNRWWQAALKK